MSAIAAILALVSANQSDEAITDLFLPCRA